MKRFLVALPVILIALLVAGAAPARAAGAPSASQLGVTPVGASRVAVSVDPGASVQRSFVVANRSAGLRFTVRLSTVDATARGGGGVRFAKSASTGGPAGWLTLSDLVATLEPGAKLRVALTVAPPANADPQSVFAGLVVRVDRAVRTADGTAVPKHPSVLIPVAIKVRGAPTALVSIEHVGAVKRGGKAFLEITFQNSGATSNTMVGRVQVLGSHPRTSPVQTALAPLTHTIVRVPFAMPPGAKSVPVSVETADTGGDQAAWNGSVAFAAAPKKGESPESGPRSNGSAKSGSSKSVRRPNAFHRLLTTIADHTSNLPSAAPILVGVALLAAVAWFGAELRRSRRRRRVFVLAPVAAATVPSVESQPVEELAPALAAYVPAVEIPAAEIPAATPAPLVAAAPVVAGNGVSHAGDHEQLSAVASQLGALVDAIDRLVHSIGSGLSIGVSIGTGQPGAAPLASVTAGTAPPHTPDEPSPALFYAASVPPVDESDPYDWPTQAQLDEFAARRRAAEADS